jgi:RsiW-degrading membrane proteinase PrsW (M82 family)
MSLLWSIFITVSPAIAFLCYFYERDRHHGKSSGAKIKVFLLGTSSIIPLVIIEKLVEYWFNSGKLSSYLKTIIA